MRRRLTRCPEVEPAPRALTPAAVVRILSLLAVVLVLALMHLHLRFSLNGLRAQIISQQNQEERLRNDIKLLEARTEALKHRDRLQAYASNELGMVRLDPNHARAQDGPGSCNALCDGPRSSRLGPATEAAGSEADGSGSKPWARN